MSEKLSELLKEVEKKIDEVEELRIISAHSRGKLDAFREVKKIIMEMLL